MFDKLRKKSDSLIAGVLITTVFILWESVVRIADTPIYILPSPSRILVTLFNHPKTYLHASYLTISEALAGLLLGMLTGILTATILGFFPNLERGVMTIAIFIKSTPLVAIAPLLTIWLGFGVLPKIIITALLTFFPVLVNLLSGLQSTDSAYLDTLNSWNANRWEIFRHAQVPSSLPYLFAALKVTAPLSLIGAVVAEWTGASGGLGRTMWLAYSNLNLPFLFGAVFILAAAGMGFFAAINVLEKKVIFWHPQNLS